MAGQSAVSHRARILTEDEEKQLVNYLIEMSEKQLDFNLSDLRKLALKMVQNRPPDIKQGDRANRQKTELPGEHWARSFITRYSDQIKEGKVNQDLPSIEETVLGGSDDQQPSEARPKRNRDKSIIDKDGWNGEWRVNAAHERGETHPAIQAMTQVCATLALFMHQKGALRPECAKVGESMIFLPAYTRK